MFKEPASEAGSLKTLKFIFSCIHSKGQVRQQLKLSSLNISKVVVSETQTFEVYQLFQFFKQKGA
jgi:hypothetical protein